MSKLKATNGKEGEILQVSGSSRSRNAVSDGAVEQYPRTTASKKGTCICYAHVPVLPQKRSACTRKRQAKRPCLGTEGAAEDDGCSSSAWRDNISDESSTDSSNDIVRTARAAVAARM